MFVLWRCCVVVVHVGGKLGSLFSTSQRDNCWKRVQKVNVCCQWRLGVDVTPFTYTRTSGSCVAYGVNALVWRCGCSTRLYQIDLSRQ